MSWYKKAKEKDLEEYQEYGWTSIDVPQNIIDKVEDMQKTIDEEDLFVKKEGDWKYGLEDEFHITVKWGLVTKDAEKVKDIVECFQGGEVNLYKVDLFENEEFDVLKISVDSDALSELNHTITDNLETHDTHPTYNPHITIAYLKPGLGKKYAGGNEFEGVKFSFNKITFEDSEDKKTVIILKDNMALENK